MKANARGEYFRALAVKDSNSIAYANMTGLDQWDSPALDRENQARETFQKAFSRHPNQDSAVYLAMLSRDRDSSEAIRWSLKAMEFPQLSLHALSHWERAVQREPKLASQINERVRQLQRHRDRWNQTIKERGLRLKATRISLAQNAPPTSSPELTFRQEKTKLSAVDRNGKELWSQALQEPKKLVAAGPRLFIIGAKTVDVMEAKTGMMLHQWPSQVVMDHRPESKAESLDGLGQQAVWSAWEDPDALIRADGEMFWIRQSRWCSFLRQKDARGWSRYWAEKLLLSDVSGGTVGLVVDGEILEVRQIDNGKLLWSAEVPKRLGLQPLEFTPNEAVVLVKEVGKIFGLQRTTGKKLWSLSHRDI